MDFPVVDLKATGQKICRLMDSRGLTVKEISEMSGLTIHSIYHWQYGMCLPAIDNLVILSSILGVTMDEIVVTR